MNKALIVDVSDSDRRLMAGLLVKSGYEPIAVESMEAAEPLHPGDSLLRQSGKLITAPPDPNYN